MISTDDSRIFSSALTISQDIILPLRKKAFTPKQHIKMLRLISIGVGIFFFLGSSFMAQLDYIQLFVIIMTSLWMGGCGPMLIFGLYSRFGTTAGAFASVISGMLLTVTSILLQRNWADYVYPFLETWGWVDNIDALLVSASAPLNPYVVWKMNPIKFPINSYEIFFITMVMCLLIYCIVSWVTCKEPFNLERMLHRGKYAIDGEKKTRMSWSIRTLFLKLTGITPEYSRQDKITAWALFTYSFIYQLGFIFFGVVIWNLISPWPLERWGTYFLITMLIVPCVIALIATFWFGIGGVADLYRLFRDLKNRTVNPLDDGRVEGHVSVADQAEFKEIESKNIEG
jgi:Na+/proline symporter